MVLHQFAPWISIQAQVLDGPPGGHIRRPSSFLLIPVGSHRQGFACGDSEKIKAVFLRGPIIRSTTPENLQDLSARPEPSKTSAHDGKCSGQNKAFEIVPGWPSLHADTAASEAL